MSIEVKLANSDLVALIDEADAELVLSRQWKLFRRRGGLNYAITRGRSAILMHRLLLSGKFIDHKDGNGLNNMRDNLRVCSHHENMMNRKAVDGCVSRFKGVTLNRSTGGWRARAQLNGRTVSFGTFTTEEAAARAYDIGAQSLFGAFARTNKDLGLL